MRALVVYESMYGNTREIAGNIADGLRSNYEVTLVPVAGAPTHVHGLPSVGYRLVAAPESFLVSWETTLLDGEAGRARRWGMTLGTASKAYLPARA
jgi:hypothetical protein